jgi:hypothetical protein
LPQESFTCKVWIWVDLVSEYVERIVKIRTSKLQAEQAGVLEVLEEKIETLRCREMELVDQCSFGGRANCLGGNRDCNPDVSSVALV